MAEAEQMRSCQTADQAVVDHDCRAFVAFAVFFQHNHIQFIAALAGQIAGFDKASANKHAVHQASGQQFEIMLLSLDFIVGVAENEAEPLGACFSFQVLGDCRIIGVFNIRHDKAEQFGASQFQRPGGEVGVVAKALDRPLDFFRVSSETTSILFTARLTVAIDTPAKRATSLIEAMISIHSRNRKRMEQVTIQLIVIRLPKLTNCSAARETRTFCQE